MADAEKITELIEEAKKPGTFSILAAVNERAYPKDEVNIFLDEEVAYDAARVKEKIREVDAEAKASDSEDVVLKREKEIERLNDELNSVTRKLEESRYVFHIRGISEGERERLYNESVEQFPIEYEQERNPLTGEMVKTELENAQRDRAFTNRLWAAYIEKIVSPDGAEQNGLTFEEVTQLRNQLPIAATAKINEAIETIRYATAGFMLEVNEDFLAKP